MFGYILDASVFFAHLSRVWLQLSIGKNNQDLSKSFLLKENVDTFIEIEIPEYNWVKGQPVNINLYSKNTEHVLKIKSMSIVGRNNSTGVKINKPSDSRGWQNNNEIDPEFESVIIPKNNETCNSKYSTWFDLRYSNTFN